MNLTSHKYILSSELKANVFCIYFILFIYFKGQRQVSLINLFKLDQLLIFEII